MEEQAGFKMRRLVAIVASFLYLGYFPLFPGTIGATAGVGLYLLVYRSITAPLKFAIFHLLLIFFILILGFLTSGKAEEVFQERDAGKIVIDEVGGMLIALFMVPFSPLHIVIGFFIFRIIDAWKPYPIRSIEKKKGSLGIMGDDILAGVCTNLLLQFVIRGVGKIW